jgi:adenylate kinase family enzyme
LEEKIKSTRKSGIILDGFPRTEGQLVAYLRTFPVDLVLNLTLSDSVLLEKLMGRRTCSNCGEGYNICNIQRYLFHYQGTVIKWIHFFLKRMEFAMSAVETL